MKADGFVVGGQEFTPGLCITQEAITGYVTARAWELGATGMEVRGPWKQARLVAARALIARELRQAPWELSLKEIGHALGGRDHSTVFNLLRSGRHK